MKKETILIVDDDRELRLLLRVLLSPAYDAIEAENGRQGLLYADQFDPDLILLDMSMPEMSGIEMLEELQQKGCKIPVIFITAAGSEYVAIQAFKLGVHDYLTKPFHRHEVSKAIDNALRETRLVKEQKRLENQLAAIEAVHQTVTTLSHHINNQLMVIQGGLSLLCESHLWQEMIEDDPALNEILADSQAGASYINAVLRVLQRVTNIELSTYHDEEMMIDIKTVLKEELQMVESER